MHPSSPRPRRALLPALALAVLALAPSSRGEAMWTAELMGGWSFPFGELRAEAHALHLDALQAARAMSAAEGTEGYLAAVDRSRVVLRAFARKLAELVRVGYRETVIWCPAAARREVVDLPAETAFAMGVLSTTGMKPPLREEDDPGMRDAVRRARLIEAHNEAAWAVFELRELARTVINVARRTRRLSPPKNPVRAASELLRLEGVDKRVLFAPRLPEES